ncbi:TRAP transporter small permease subunit [Cognatishimia sp. SS12]|uniref:TRAP transporter small permease subunit n=1 Tax=Cognatishimia sp. SS12 TaxID=2979465 RepID=UPI00233043AD|nr:TRAP transporter small permease subunit [Cognatishimia sp. SS12]MDC0738894.1 TRAP transporter small permease subunit [Cognatishimia sp. SS12]
MTTQSLQDNAASGMGAPDIAPQPANFVRSVGWISLFLLMALLLNNVLVFAAGFPDFFSIFSGAPKSALSIAIFGAAVVAAIALVLTTQSRSLRDDALRIARFNAYLIRGFFFAVLFVGLVDVAIAFMRVENLLINFMSIDTARAFGRASFVGMNVHIPLVVLGFVVALFSRTIGFTWLALMIVVAELLIVITRFLFSYEQALMGDLVRYWYAALFLFASAHTLFENGHVRVDVLYAGLNGRRKGAVNGIGTILLGMTTMWTIILIGFGHSRAIINSPLLNFEISQTGSAGMYIKYHMAAYLGIFAITMLIQFVSYLFEAYADYRGEPGAREIAPAAH